MDQVGDDENAAPAAANAGSTTTNGDSQRQPQPPPPPPGSLLKRRMNRSPPSLQIGDDAANNNDSDNDIVVVRDAKGVDANGHHHGNGIGNNGYSHGVSPREESTPSPDVDWGVETPSTGGQNNAAHWGDDDLGNDNNGNGNRGGNNGVLGGGVSSSRLGRRAAAANAQRQARVNGAEGSSVPTTPNSSAPVWLSNDPPADGGGPAAAGAGAVPFDPFAPSPRVAHSPPLNARRRGAPTSVDGPGPGHRMPRISNSMDNLRVPSMDFGAEASTPSGGGGGAGARSDSSTPPTVPGAESPLRRSNIGGKLTALKRRQESRRAQSANLLSTPRMDSRTSTAPDLVSGGAGESGPGYPDSGTPLGHSYLTGRGRGVGEDSLDLGLEGQHGAAMSRTGAVAGRRAGAAGGGSMSQRRPHPGMLDVSTSGEHGGGGGYLSARE